MSDLVKIIRDQFHVLSMGDRRAIADRIEALEAKLAAVESWGKGHIKDLLKTADVLEQQGFKSVLRKTIIEIRKAADELTKALEGECTD